MSQPSILSFWGKSSAKAKVDTKSENNIKILSDSGSPLIKTDTSVKDSDKEIDKKVSKRRRIINSESDSSSDTENKSKVIRVSESLDESLKSNLVNSSIEIEESKCSSPKKELNKSPKGIDIKDTKVESPKTESLHAITQALRYDPAKKPYDIVKDACWNANDRVPYVALARTFDAIEGISQRLEITRVLSNFLRSVNYLSNKDLLPSIYLCLNKVAPDYDGVELGIGDSVIVDALVQATDTSKATVKNLMKVEGDLGNVAMALKSSQTYMQPLQTLSVVSVFNKLKEIAFMSGKTVQKKKILIIKNMLMSSRDCEKKYLVRGLMGKLRIGLAEQTVLAALGQAMTLTPPNTECKRKIKDIESLKPEIDKNTAILKNAFCECPNYNLIIETILNNGIEKLPNFCSITTGVPIKPMLAHPSKGVTEIFRRFDNVDFSCEYKYDGERAQIHIFRDAKNKDKILVQIFSRSQENNTTKYPDIVRMINEVVLNENIESCIIDSEAVAWDRKNDSILPFQVLSTRKRKDVDEKDISIQVCIYAFDLLYFNGESLVKKSFRERRDVLRKNFVETPGQFMMATSLDSIDTDEISAFLETSIQDKCEGLMIKTLDRDASYEISRRSHNWLKLKKDYLDNIGDSLDLVVIGASFGNGKRANKYGNFLLACYEPDAGSYQSICKLGTGLSDEKLDEVYVQLKDIVINRPMRYFELDSNCKMDVWFQPTFVWEIKAADFSISPLNKAAIGLVDKDKGISLRFPRFLRVRDDKKPEDATTSRQIAEMYRNQAQIKNEKNPFEDDDFY